MCARFFVNAPVKPPPVATRCACTQTISTNVSSTNGGLITDQSFLTAGYHIGINTIGQSLRNANLQLRSEPANPQIPVSPWGISTIEPDIRQVGFEIGSGASK